VRIVCCLGVAVLVGCATKAPAQALSPDAAIDAIRQGPYTKGRSTENELFAFRGQPLSRETAADGTRTDIYPTQMTYVDGSGGTLKVVRGPANIPNMRTHYVYSADGVLQRILLDTITKGPNGEDEHHIAEAQDSVTVTARRTAPGGS